MLRLRRAAAQDRPALPSEPVTYAYSDNLLHVAVRTPRFRDAYHVDTLYDEVCRRVRDEGQVQVALIVTDADIDFLLLGRIITLAWWAARHGGSLTVVGMSAHHKSVLLAHLPAHAFEDVSEAA